MLYPDLLLDSVKDLTPEFLMEYGIKGIIFDLDETLAPRHKDGPGEDILAHIELLKKSGITMALVSNSPRDRVSDFNREMQISFFPKAQKPRVKVLKRAVKFMGFPNNRIAMVGDQIFTDVLAGNRIGLLTVMVSPLEDRKTKFFRFKRYLERIILHHFEGGLTK